MTDNGFRRFTNPDFIRIVKECNGPGTRDVARSYESGVAHLMSVDLGALAGLPRTKSRSSRTCLSAGPHGHR